MPNSVLEIFGGGIQINNIPVDALQRIDVYKGVMPVDVGTDALGGGINLVPNESFKENLRASYSVGSFNTHRVTLNASKEVTPKLSATFFSYANYSDNDFLMKNVRNLSEVTLPNGLIALQENQIDRVLRSSQRIFYRLNFSTSDLVLDHLRAKDLKILFHFMDIDFVLEFGFNALCYSWI